VGKAQSQLTGGNWLCALLPAPCSLPPAPCSFPLWQKIGFRKKGEMMINHKKAKTNQGNEPIVSMLIDSAYYFLHEVVIIKDPPHFRLLAINKFKGKKIDKHYDTAKGARIAFAKLFKDKKCKATKPEWSPLFQPEPGWLETMLKMPIKRKEAIDARNRNDECK
jgi:hypothetical protein